MSTIARDQEKPKRRSVPVAAPYIAQLTRELASLARADGCNALAYMLDIAAMEAEIISGLPEGCRPS